jgi:hypothetical protein
MRDDLRALHEETVEIAWRSSTDGHTMSTDVAPEPPLLNSTRRHGRVASDRKRQAFDRANGAATLLPFGSCRLPGHLEGWTARWRDAGARTNKLK